MFTIDLWFGASVDASLLEKLNNSEKSPSG